MYVPVMRLDVLGGVMHEDVLPQHPMRTALVILRPVSLRTSIQFACLQVHLRG